MLFCRSGTVESKIRLLVKQLEYVDTLSLAHPFVDGFDRVNYCVTSDESQIIMTGELPADIAARTKEECGENPNLLKVYTTSFFIGLMVEPRDRQCLSYPPLSACKRLRRGHGPSLASTDVSGFLMTIADVCTLILVFFCRIYHFHLETAASRNARKLDIAYPTQEWTKMVKAWDRFEHDKMGIVMRHVKAYGIFL